jgi:hypothetical protein
MHKVSGCIWVIQGHLGPKLELINIVDSQMDSIDVYHFPRDGYGSKLGTPIIGGLILN